MTWRDEMAHAQSARVCQKPRTWLSMSNDALMTGTVAAKASALADLRATSVTMRG